MAPRKHTLGLRAACAALALTMVGAACSGDDSVSDAASDTTAESTPATTARPATTAVASDSATSESATTTSVTDSTAAATVPVDDTTTSTTEAPTTTEAATTTTVPVPVYPLTGVQDPDPAIASRAALVVKIGNEPAARPQTGFNAADIVLEEIVNDRFTRFALVFQSGDSDPVGPIRSGRLQDVDLFGSFNEPLFSWSGGNATVTRAIDSSDLINIGPNHARVYFRSNQRRAPSNLYSNTSQLRTFAPFGAPPPPQHFQYRDPAAPAQGSPSAGVGVQLDSISVEWTWNPDDGLYYRKMEGQVHRDAASGQVTTNNVVVMNMEYLPGISGSPDAQSVGWGEVFVFTGGNYVHGTWSRDDRKQPWRLTADDGSPILLSPGRTFIELPRADSTLPFGPA